MKKENIANFTDTSLWNAVVEVLTEMNLKQKNYYIAPFLIIDSNDKVEKCTFSNFAELMQHYNLPNAPNKNTIKHCNISGEYPKWKWNDSLKNGLTFVNIAKEFIKRMKDKGFPLKTPRRKRDLSGTFYRPATDL